MNHIEDNEVDLFDFFETLWESKGLISLFIIITLLLGVVLNNSIEPKYESKIFYIIDKTPPFNQKIRMVSKDYEKLFYNKKIFSDWKSANENSALMFNDISAIQNAGNVFLSKPERKRTVLHAEDDQFGPYILVRSNKTKLLDEIFKYANYVNDELSIQYITRAEDEIKIMYKRFNDPSATTDTLTEDILAVDRFLVEAKKGNKVLLLTHPSFPELISPRTNLILVISFLLGFMIAIIYIFFRDGYRNRKVQGSKSSEIL
jgi:capsular polysaccharide biosynthesis protein